MKLKALFVLAAFTFVSAEVGLAALSDARTQTMEGRRLSAKDAEQLESSLAADPEDLSARTKLLAYYFGKTVVSKDAKAAQRNHALWVIEHHPEAEIAGLPECGIIAGLDKEGYAKAKQLWLQQTATHEQNALVQGNAAQFFFVQDADLAEKSLKQAQQLEPNNPKWSEKLGHLYTLGVKGSPAKALEQFEKAQSADPSGESRQHRLPYLAKAAVNAGELDKASKYSNELLKSAETYAKDSNYGNAIHHGNNVLGLVALKKGNTKQAAEYLLKAGATPGSPQLDSFGPNMVLAKELLEKGEKEAVLQYFDLCRNFWKSDRDRLDAWKKEVEEGKIPKFGANLRY